MNLSIEIPDELAAALSARAAEQGLTLEGWFRKLAEEEAPETEGEEQAKLEWLRAAAKEGFDAIERGDYVTLRSDREIDDVIERLGDEAAAELSAERDRA